MKPSRHQAKKSLGQHFLRSQKALGDIVNSGEIKKDEVVLEIGPGEGALTHALLEKGARVIAIEPDTDLIPILLKKFRTAIHDARLTLIHGDALDFEWGSLVSQTYHTTSYKCIANIPYYITGALIRKIFQSSHLPELAVLLIQKEVAERICARDGKESILSLSVKVYGVPKIISLVKAGSFVPRPKVDSAVLHISSLSKKNLPTSKDEEKFFDLLHRGFSSKRKKLFRNLGYSKEHTKTLTETLGISDNVRAEDLTLAQWLYLTTEELKVH